MIVVFAEFLLYEISNSEISVQQGRRNMYRHAVLFDFLTDWSHVDTATTLWTGPLSIGEMSSWVLL